MKKTYFVEIVMNNLGEMASNTRFLRCNIQAHNPDMATNKALSHYVHYYTGGDKGRFYVQCCWEVDVPKRELFEKHWRTIIKNSAIDESKADALLTWDVCNAGWSNPIIHYEPTKGGYMIQLHNHMEMAYDFKLFKGHTKAVYDKAVKWVKANTFRGDHYREPKL